MPEASRMEKAAAPWRPWRSRAAWYMWRVVEDRRTRPEADAPVTAKPGREKR
jgi:3-methyladenine DNA glycosylase/8-oxoguanine DNA glycosylase